MIEKINLGYIIFKTMHTLIPKLSDTQSKLLKLYLLYKMVFTVIFYHLVFPSTISDLLSPNKYLHSSQTYARTKSCPKSSSPTQEPTPSSPLLLDLSTDQP